MLCQKCGFTLEESTKVCGNCGAEVPEVVEKVAETEAPASESSVEVMEEEPVVQKKKSVLPKVLIAVVAVVAVAVGLFFGFKDAIVSKFTSLMPAETQLQMAYKGAAEDWGKGTGIYITEVEKNLDMVTTSASKGTLAIDVNQLILQQLLGMDIGVNRIYMDYEVIQNVDAFGVYATLGLEETDIVSMDITMDMEKGKMMILIPEMSDQAIERELELTQEDLEYYSQMAEMQDMYSAILPDAEYAEEFIPKYIGVAFKAIDEVERVKDTLEVGGISQKATSLTVTFDADMVEKVGKAVVDELKKDEEFEKNLKELYETTMEMSGEEAGDWADAYEEALDEIELMFEELAKSEEVQEGIEFVTWVDSNNEIIGIEAAERIMWTSAKEKEKIAHEFVLTESSRNEERVKVLIEGKEVEGTFSGEIALFVEKEEIIVFDIQKYKITDKGMDYIAEATIKSEMLEALTGESVLLGDIMLRMEMTSSEEASNLVVKASVNNMECISMEISGEVSTDKKEIEYPDNVTSDMEAWSYTLDLTKVIDNLEKSGLSEILLQQLFASPDAI